MEEEKQSKVLISIESVKLLTSSGSEGEDLLNGIEQQLNKLCIKSANLLDLDATVVHQTESTEPLISNMVFLDIFILPNFIIYKEQQVVYQSNFAY